MTVYDELYNRELINQLTNEKFPEYVKEKRTIYVGIDPTGETLHVGHLMPIVLLKHFQNYGHQVIAVMGGSTGLIGDPSFKKDERTLLDYQTVQNNIESISRQVDKLLGDTYIKENNINWTGNKTMIEFLRDYGKYFNINTMMSKDSVKSRLETGISFTEFSYQILQAMDFKFLYETYNCTIQVGGSDQWGNIVAGTELIRKTSEDAEVYGVTVPLITDSEGRKFGKSEGNAIWLDENKTSIYDFYQYFVNSNDADVIKYIKSYTFLEKEEIERLEKTLEEKPFLRAAQKKLAFEMTKFVHGEENANLAIKISESLFSGDLKQLSVTEIEKNLSKMPRTKIADQTSLVDGLVQSELASSKREAREFISNNSIKINGEQIASQEYILSKEIAIGGKFLLLKRGKKKFMLVEVI